MDRGLSSDMGPEIGQQPPQSDGKDRMGSKHLPICLDAPFQVQHLFFDLGHDGEKSAVLLTAGILQAPVLTVGTGQGWALDLTAHSDHKIHRRQLGEGFAVLVLLHVDAIDLLHQTHRIWVDPAAGLSSGGDAAEHLAGQSSAQSLRHLAAAGVMDAEEGHGGLFAIHR